MPESTRSLLFSPFFVFQVRKMCVSRCGLISAFNGLRKQIVTLKTHHWTFCVEEQNKERGTYRNSRPRAAGRVGGVSRRKGAWSEHGLLTTCSQEPLVLPVRICAAGNKRLSA